MDRCPYCGKEVVFVEDATGEKVSFDTEPTRIITDFPDGRTCVAMYYNRHECHKVIDATIIEKEEPDEKEN